MYIKRSITFTYIKKIRKQIHSIIRKVGILNLFDVSNKTYLRLTIYLILSCLTHTFILLFLHNTTQYRYIVLKSKGANIIICTTKNKLKNAIYH